MQVTLGGQDAERLIHGVEDGGAGRIVEGLCEVGVNNVDGMPGFASRTAA